MFKIVISVLLSFCLFSVVPAYADGQRYHPWNGVSPEDLEQARDCRLGQEGYRAWFESGGSLTQQSSPLDNYRNLVNGMRETVRNGCSAARDFLNNICTPLSNRYSELLGRNLDGSLNDEVAAVREEMNQANLTLCHMNNRCNIVSEMLNEMINHADIYMDALLQAVSQERSCALAYYTLMMRLTCPPRSEHAGFGNPWNSPANGLRVTASGSGFPQTSCTAYMPYSGPSVGAIRTDPPIDVSGVASPMHLSSPFNTNSGPLSALLEQAMRARGFRPTEMRCELPLPTSLKWPEEEKDFSPLEEKLEKQFK